MKPVGDVWAKPTQAWSVPVPSLSAQFDEHAARLDADPTQALWNEWFPAFLRNEFEAHAERLGAEADEALWAEWYPAWKSNAGA